MPHPPALPGAIDIQALTGLCTAEQLRTVTNQSADLIILVVFLSIFEYKRAHFVTSQNAKEMEFGNWSQFVQSVGVNYRKSEPVALTTGGLVWIPPS
jgi:hypothetical protein